MRKATQSICRWSQQESCMHAAMTWTELVGVHRHQRKAGHKVSDLTSESNLYSAGLERLRVMMNSRAHGQVTDNI